MKISLLFSSLLISFAGFSQINITFTVDIAGFSLAPAGLHIAGEFATDSSTTILTQWDPAAPGSQCSLVNGTTYSVTVGFPLSSAGKFLQWEFVRNDWWDYLGVDMSEGNFGDPTNFLDYSCGTYDYAGGLNRIITIPDCGGEYTCLFNQCGFVVPTPCDTLYFACNSPIICEKFCVNFLDSTNNNATGWQWSFPGGNPSSSTEQNPTNICYDSPGMYDVNLITTSANGVDTFVKPNYITVNPTPPIPTITQAGYTLTSSTAAFYQWQFNTADIPGATDQSYTVMQSGYYDVVIHDSTGCTNVAGTWILIEGIDEVNNDAYLAAMPNPFSGSTTVSFSLLSPQKVSLRIFDVEGRLIHTLANDIMSEGPHLLRWDARDENGIEIPAGIYFLKIENTSESEMVRLIVMK